MVAHPARIAAPLTIGPLRLYNRVMRTHLAPVTGLILRTVTRNLRRQRIERRLEQGIDRAGDAMRRVAADVDDLQDVLRDAVGSGAVAVAPLARSRRTRAIAIGALIVAVVTVLAIVIARRRAPADVGETAPE